MIQLFYSMLRQVAKNSLLLLLTPNMVIWAARVAVSRTDNLIDDNCVALLEAAYNNDAEGFKRAIISLNKLTKHTPEA